jgi:hypothetical protein
MGDTGFVYQPVLSDLQVQGAQVISNLNTLSAEEQYAQKH